MCEWRAVVQHCDRICVWCVTLRGVVGLGVLCARSSRVRVVASAQWCAGTARGKIASNILMTTITHEIYETKREDSVSCRRRRQIRLSGSGDSGILLRLWRAGGSVTKERRAAAVGFTTDTPSPKRGRPGIRAKRPAPGAGTIWRRARPYLAWSTISAPRAADRALSPFRAITPSRRERAASLSLVGARAVSGARAAEEQRCFENPPAQIPDLPMRA